MIENMSKTKRPIKKNEGDDKIRKKKGAR